MSDQQYERWQDLTDDPLNIHVTAETVEDGPLAVSVFGERRAFKALSLVCSDLAEGGDSFSLSPIGAGCAWFREGNLPVNRVSSLGLYFHHLPCPGGRLPLRDGGSVSVLCFFPRAEDWPHDPGSLLIEGNAVLLRYFADLFARFASDGRQEFVQPPVLAGRVPIPLLHFIHTEEKMRSRF